MTEPNPENTASDQDVFPPRHGRTPEAALNAAERRHKVLHHRLAGASLRQIAARLQVSVAQVRRDLNAALAELDEQQDPKNLMHLRALEASRIDEMFRAVWPGAKQGLPINIQQALQLMERRARLYGLDAAVKVDVLLATEMENLLDALRKGMTEDEFRKVLSILAVSGTS